MAANGVLTWWFQKTTPHSHTFAAAESNAASGIILFLKLRVSEAFLNSAISSNLFRQALFPLMPCLPRPCKIPLSLNVCKSSKMGHLECSVPELNLFWLDFAGTIHLCYSYSSHQRKGMQGRKVAEQPLVNNNIHK
jgi:hypothetical protein